MAIEANTAREHALRASELLNEIDRVQEEAREFLDDPDRRAQAMISGGIKQHNERMKWTLDVAHAHATTALALAATDESDE